MAVSGNIDDWGNLFNVWNSSASGLKGFGTKSTPAHIVSDKVRNIDVLPGLLQELGTLPVEHLQKGGRVGKALLAAFGVRSGKPVRWVQATGTRRDLYTMLMKLSIEAQGKGGISPEELKVPVENQLNTFKLEGVDLDATQKYWTVAIDTDAQAKLAHQGGTAAQRSEPLGKTVKVISVEELKSNVFDLASHPGVLGGVGLVLSILALRGASSADATMTGFKGRAKLKITALYGAAASGLADLTRGATVAVKGSRIPMLGSWLEDALSKRTLAVWEGAGAVLGGASLLALGAIDGYNAFEAISRDQMGLGALYVIGAISEVAVGGYTMAVGVGLILRLNLTFLGAAVGLSVFNPVIFCLTLVIVFVGALAAALRPPPTTDWARKCLWAKGKERNSYRDGKEEIAEFNKAVKA